MTVRECQASVRARRKKHGRRLTNRHYDVTGKECPYYFVKHPDAWEGLLNSLTYTGIF
ncbi:MAG: hypothetical protein HFG58_10780 [Lachnospiraceae bacterium]|nr:hypothetical protein [Lachnospiraceae bacterium]